MGATFDRGRIPQSAFLEPTPELGCQNSELKFHFTNKKYIRRTLKANICSCKFVWQQTRQEAIKTRIYQDKKLSRQEAIKTRRDIYFLIPIYA